MEKIAASLTKNSSEITDIYERANNLLITGANQFVVVNPVNDITVKTREGIEKLIREVSRLA